MTPLNFTFWGNLNPVTQRPDATVALRPWAMLKVIVLLLGLPLVAGHVGVAPVPGLCARAPTSR